MKKKANNAWSDKLNKKDEREKRREKKDRKKQWLKAQQQKDPSEPNFLKRGRDSKDLDGGDGDEWAELAREERMAKKVRKGDLTQVAFDEEFAA